MEVWSSITARWAAAICTKDVTGVFRWRRRITSTQVVRYVERNALRANLADRAENWPWSSLRRQKCDDVAFPILAAWPLPRPADWLQIVNQPQTEAELESSRCCANRERPYGSSAWVDETATRLGLELTLRPRGRPKKPRQLSTLPILPGFGGRHLCFPAGSFGQKNSRPW